MKTRLYLWAICFACTLTACRSFRELRALTKCEFRNKDFGRLEVSGLNLLQYEDISQINLLEAGKLALQMSQQPEVPMFVTFNVEVRNSHDKVAALEKMDWILEVDKRDIISGTSVDRFEVQPNSTGVLPIQTSFDIKKILSKTSLDGIFALIKGINGTNEEETRIRLKIKPRFRVAGVRIGYPGYIKIGKTFESTKAQNAK